MTLRHPPISTLSKIIFALSRQLATRSLFALCIFSFVTFALSSLLCHPERSEGPVFRSEFPHSCGTWLYPRLCARPILVRNSRKRCLSTHGFPAVPAGQLPCRQLRREEIRHPHR